jgi:hypothetical protein
MSTKTEIVVCRASYCKVFSTIFRRVSFSTATPVNNTYAKGRLLAGLPSRYIQAAKQNAQEGAERFVKAKSKESSS